jgi:hypothetical protein
MAAIPSASNYGAEVQLHRLPLTSSTTTNPLLDTSTLAPQNPFLDDDDASILASTTLGLLPDVSFAPSSTLQIQATGKHPCSFPLPSKELTISIFSLTTGRPVYLSLRVTRRSGNCRLVLADDENEVSVATTTYWFGPGRSPVIRILNGGAAGAAERGDEFELKSKNLVTRTVCFESRRYGAFEWRYAGKQARAAAGLADVNNLLVLEKIELGTRTRVAQLVRSDSTRTAGTRPSAAGNGGKLEMCLVGENGDEWIDEVTVVTSCLVMLKKEVDRLRTVQIMIMAGAGGGGA